MKTYEMYYTFTSPKQTDFTIVRYAYVTTYQKQSANIFRNYLLIFFTLRGPQLSTIFKLVNQQFQYSKTFFPQIN